MNNSLKKLRVGIAGLGTVGRGVYQILQKDRQLIESRSNCEIEVTAVSSRSNKDFIDKKIKFYTNPLDMADDENVDVIVELIGGVDIAKDLILRSLKNSKKVVTANKALLAEHGAELALAQEKFQGVILYEASVAGANPIIKAFREGFSANVIKEVYGILNGTCNFILTKMLEEKRDYSAILKEAQQLGFAEADPTFDVEGIDTAHKIAIISSLAFATLPNFKDIHIEGINSLSIQDLEIAYELGYKIKLLGIFKNNGNNIQQSVYPALISKNEKIAQIDGSYNAILTLGSNCEFNMMVGRGAGDLTTGSAVVADLIDIASNRENNLLFNAKLADLKTVKTVDLSSRIGKYFISFIISKDHANEKNFIKKYFDNIFEIEKIIYKKIDENNFTCALITNQISEEKLSKNIANIDSSQIKDFKFIRVEETKF
jgi:homoserine dehydrogenase